MDLYIKDIIKAFLIAYTLFRNKRFALNELFQRNASKFAIFYIYENPCSFFRFSFRATSYFYLMNALVSDGTWVPDPGLKPGFFPLQRVGFFNLKTRVPRFPIF